MMLALARALAMYRHQWRRSFVFLSLTAEETGLLGAQVSTSLEWLLQPKPRADCFHPAAGLRC